MIRSVALLVGSLVIAAVPVVAQAVAPGDTVLAYWEPERAYFLGTAIEKSGPGYLVVFEDGDRAVVPEAKIRKNDIQVGTAVMARWDDGNIYSGRVAKVLGRACYIHDDDGDKGWVPWSWIAVK
jgi:hypothetical protein